MRPISDYIVSGMPGMALVERDARYSRLAVPDALAEMPKQAPRPFLEWTMMQGWNAAAHVSADLISASGLNIKKPAEERDGVYPDMSRAPADALVQLRDWLVSRRDGGQHAFTRGMVVLHDMCDERNFHPYMVRVVAETVDAIARLSGMAIFISGAKIPPGSMIRTVLPVVEAEISPWTRYGRIARGFLQQVQGDDRRAPDRGQALPREEQIMIYGICMTLSGLTLSEAELALRLTLFDKATKSRQGHALSLEQTLARLKEIADERKAAENGP